MRSCLVTGGAGFLGRSLAVALADRGCHVIALDTQRFETTHENITAVAGDIREASLLASLLDNVDTVFHTASIVELGTTVSKRRRQQVIDVNVGGTQTIIDACIAAGVERLVYTSSCNVAFTGKSFDVVTEEAPYAPSPRDPYGATKQTAERLVLAANGRDGLMTAAIRPSGIYGPGEQHHLPRLVDQCVRHRFVALVGTGHALSEWSYIENLVFGHLLAADALVPGGVACGQAYFINDGVYIDSAEMFRPIVEALGHRWPRLRVPAVVAGPAAAVLEYIHRLGGPVPLFTRVEVQKMAVQFPCSIDKARRELGYDPVVAFDEAVLGCIPYCQQLREQRLARGPERRKARRVPAPEVQPA